MIITVRTILVALLELLSILPEALLALLARKDHLILLHQRVVCRLLMALRAVEPFLACVRDERVSRAGCSRPGDVVI